jgi:hypothetical protein
MSYVRVQVHTAKSVMITVFWVVTIALMMEAARTYEMSVNSHQAALHSNGRQPFL